MSRRYAIITLAIVALVFLIGVADITFVAEQNIGPITARLTSLTGVILSGVAIGSILAGLRRNNGNGRPPGGRDPNDPDDSTGDRSRQTARIEHQHEEGEFD